MGFGGYHGDSGLRPWLAETPPTPPPLLSSGGEVSRSGDFSGTSGKRKSLRTETEAAWPGAFWELQFGCLGILYAQAKRSGSVARVATASGRHPRAWFHIRLVRPEALLSHLHSDRKQRPLGFGAWRGAGLSEAAEPQGTRSAPEEQRWKGKGMSSA